MTNSLDSAIQEWRENQCMKGFTEKCPEALDQYLDRYYSRLDPKKEGQRVKCVYSKCYRGICPFDGG